MVAIQPELWVDHANEAVAFYEAAFGAKVQHRVGEGEDIVAQLAVGGAAFWVAAASSAMKRFSPRTIDGATSRTLLVVDDPDATVAQAVSSGGTELAPVADEHGWRVESGIHSGTNGRSERRSAPGRQADLGAIAALRQKR